MGAAAMAEREEMGEENEQARVPFVLPFLYPIWNPGGKPAAPGCVSAVRLASGFAGRCAGPPGEAAGARQACTGILFWPGFRCSSVQAPGWPVHRSAAPGISRKTDQAPFLDDTKL
jgi:hypothetical protein